MGYFSIEVLYFANMGKIDKNILYRFFSRNASIEEEIQVLDWLDELPDHQDEFNKERACYNMSILASKEDEIKNTAKKRSIFKYNRIKEVMKAAAVLLIAFGVSYYYISSKENELQSLTNTITVPAGQRANITLSDGTQVWMNAQSELKYPAYFAGNVRRVRLSGEAYFEVAHNQKKTFIVETQSCDVEVLGTTFDVSAYTEIEEFSTSLLTGTVKITNKNNVNDYVVLEPRQRVCFSGDKFVVEPITDYDLLRWREGLICFKEICFKDLMKQFEKHYGVKIIIESETIKNNVFSGKLRINDGIDHALRVLQKNAPFLYRRDNQGVDYIYITDL